eukprot:CAMPEP_0185724698 /NCGR_PEP_ID=MMETSP1171-20130828/1106_1 /TAXON_ID=374046 /ORGANISM="Helicotheca tamensis, Strain CCMP826" /LENGTH=241 /DNA_ID=CAMNT_0028392613 /DNA_START=11 /DNA_END=736 /DNA_ORIENTATION=-
MKVITSLFHLVLLQQSISIIVSAQPNETSQYRKQQNRPYMPPEIIHEKDELAGRLFEACSSPVGKSSIHDVKLALVKGADIDHIDEESGQTPLIAASLQGNEEFVKHLIENGADTSIADPKWEGLDLIHILASEGQKKIIKLLHKMKPHLDLHEYHDDDGLLPLHRACLGMDKGHADTVKFLCQEYSGDAHVNSKVKSTKKSVERGYDGKTCLELTKNEGTKYYIEEFMKVRKILPMGDEL